MDSAKWLDINNICHLSSLRVYKKVGIKINRDKIIKDSGIENENFEQIQYFFQKKQNPA
jgi:hypothetical protein